MYIAHSAALTRLGGARSEAKTSSSSGRIPADSCIMAFLWQPLRAAQDDGSTSETSVKLIATCIQAVGVILYLHFKVPPNPVHPHILMPVNEIHPLCGLDFKNYCNIFIPPGRAQRSATTLGFDQDTLWHIFGQRRDSMVFRVQACKEARVLLTPKQEDVREAYVVEIGTEDNQKTKIHRILTQAFFEVNTPGILDCNQMKVLLYFRLMCNLCDC